VLEWHADVVHRLLLLRHAKSSWADPAVGDHDRPLNDRGRAAAPRVGAYLRDAALVPDLVLCSSARRARDTVAGLGLPDAVDVVVDHDLYLARPDTVVDRIRAVADDVTTLMVVGHNPTTHEVALNLAATGDGAALARLGQKFPTGAVAVLRVPDRWTDLDAGTASLERFVVPRDLE
jgi:phosphohistidine phosphatase